MSHLQNKVQQCITIKTTEMVGDGNTVNAKATRDSQHRMPDYNYSDVISSSEYRPVHTGILVSMSNGYD